MSHLAGFATNLEQAPKRALALLAFLAMPAVLWSDMLFPTLTAIQDDMHVSAMAVQQTVSLFFMANAFMCLWHGVISDAWGRRTPLFINLVLLISTSVLCAVATRIEHLWVLRTVQGLAAGVGHVLCRAIIRDWYTDATAQKMIARTSMLQSLGPILMPMVGGFITVQWGWRAVFGFLAVVGTLMLVLYFKHLPESLAPERRKPLRVTGLWTAYGSVLGSASFMRLTMAHVCNWSAMFLYVAAAPWFVTHFLQRPPTDVYLVFVPMMLGLLAGFTVLPGVLTRWGTQRTLRLTYIGFLVVNVMNLTMAIAVPMGMTHLLPIALYSLAVAMSMPLLVGHALHAFPANAGLAASCQMFLQYALMAIVAGALAPLLWDSLLHLALACAGLTAVGSGLLRWHGHAAKKLVNAEYTT